METKKTRQYQKRDTLTFDLFPFFVVLVFFVLAIVLFFSVHYGIQNGDETFYLSETHHLLMGDRLITDIWSITQFSALFQYIPMKLYTLFSGGTEGIVLAMRYAYVVMKLIAFIFVVVFLRKYRWWTLLAAVIVTSYHPLGFLTICYYSIALSTALLTGLILFTKKNLTTTNLITAGVLFSCCVLAEPLTAWVYFAYSVLVIVCYVRKKRKKIFLKSMQRLLTKQTWFGITGGVLISFIIFLSILRIGENASLIWKNLSSFAQILSFHSQMSFTEKIKLYLWQSGYVFNVSAVIFLVVILLFGKKLKKYRNITALTMCIIFVGLTVSLFLKNGVRLSAIYLTDFKPLPLFFLGFASYLLTEKKDNMLFGFFIFGSATSFGMEIVSRIAFGAGCVISAPASILLFRSLFFELLAEHKTNNTAKDKTSPLEKITTIEKEKKARFLSSLQTLLSKTTICISIAALSVLLVSESFYCFYARLFQTPESMVSANLDSFIDRGPLKGLKTIPMLKEEYDAVLSDMDTIMKQPPSSLFVMGYCAWGNLYTELPYACPAIYAFDTVESREYLEYYWQMYPERKSDCIYIPYLDMDYNIDRKTADEKLSFLQAHCDMSVTEGNIGYIVRINKWLS